MSWMSRYAVLLAAQKVTGGVPGLYRLQQAVKRRTDRSAASRDELCQRAAVKVARFVELGVRPPRVVLEQGTGWHGADLVLFHLAGADRIITCDVRPWLMLPRLLASARALGSAPGIVARWHGVDPDQVARRAQALASLDSTRLSDVLEAMGVEYRVSASFDRPEVPDGSVDLFYTDSVLQRVVPDDLTVLLGEATRVLRPGGMGYHIVDCKDFQSIRDPRVPPLWYLTVDEPIWRLLTSRYINYQNRLRRPDFVRAFQHAETDVVAMLTETFPADLPLAERLAREARFDGMTAAEIAEIRVEFLTRKQTTAGSLLRCR